MFSTQCNRSHKINLGYDVMTTLHRAAHDGTHLARHGLGVWLARGLDRLHTWHARMRTRRELAQLDDHMLDDIGLTRDMVEREYNKPFWRP